MKQLLDKLGDHIQAGIGEIRFNCPFCHTAGKRKDTDYHMYVNLDKKKFICFRCEAKGYLATLCKRLQIPFDESLTYVKPVQIIEYPYPDIVYPRPLIPFTSGCEAHQYLIRRISEQSILYYNVQWDPLGRRIVFPIKKDGRLVYWVSRSYQTQETMTYKNADVPRGYFLYNMERVREFSSVIITEGIFDAISAGFNAVASLGKMVTAYQIALLIAMKKERYYVTLDPDAMKNSVDLASKLSVGGSRVFLVSLPKGEDPNSLGAEKFKTYLNSHSFEYTAEGSLKFMASRLSNI